MQYHPPSRNLLHALHGRSMAGAGGRGRPSSSRVGSSLVGAYGSTQVADLSCPYSSVHTLSDAFDAELRPVFCVRYHPLAARDQLAVADEDGWVSILAPGRPNHEQTRATRHRFQAHSNAIFDMQWATANAAQHSGETSDEAQADVLITVSGDQTARGWDATTGACLYTLVGHRASVKTVRIQPGQPNVVLTGSRDGNVLLYDVREPQPQATPVIQPAYTIKNVHTQEAAKPKRKRAAALTVAPADSCASVTALAFLQPHLLLTAGASDADIRAWDLRAMRTRFKKASVVVASAKDFSAAASSSSSARKKKTGDTFEPVWQISAPQRRYGVSSLSIDCTGQRLLASSRDHTIRMYDLAGSGVPSASTLPDQVFTGHTSGSFFVRASWSPCGRFIASGSSDHNVYIWDSMGHRSPAPAVDVSSPEPRPATSGVRPLKILSGHTNEVSEVEWNPHAGLRGTNQYDVPFQLASCSDDSSVRIWHVDRSMRDEGVGDVLPDQPVPMPSTLAAFEPCTPPRPRLSDYSQRLLASGGSIASTVSMASTASSSFFSLASPSSSSYPISSAASSPSASHFRPVDHRSAAASPSASPTEELVDADLDMASRERSLSPVGRRMTSSSTSALGLQLTHALTVSPSKVQLAHTAHSQARHRRRLHAEESADDGCDEEEAPSASRHVARMLPIGGAALPTIRPDAFAIAPIAPTAPCPTNPLSGMSLFQPRAPAVVAPVIVAPTFAAFATPPAAFAPLAAAPTAPIVVISPTVATPAASPVARAPSRSSSGRAKTPNRGRSTSIKITAHSRPIKDFFRPIATPSQPMDTRAA